MLGIIIIIFYTFFISLIIKKTFGKVIPFSLMSIPLILYISQFMFHTFNIGLYFIIILSLMSIPLIIFKLIKHHKVKEYILTPGLYIFLFITLLVFFIDCDHLYTNWDEFEHWGMMIKEMLRLDNFYSVTESNLVWHKEYPPFISLFEFFICYISGYSEPTATIAINIFMLGLIVPFIGESLYKTFNIKILLLPVTILLLIMALDPYKILKSIIPDLVLSVLVVYPLLIIYNKDFNFYNILNIILSLISIILTKQIGIALSLMIIFFFTLIYIYNKFNKKKGIIILLLIIIIPLLFYSHWNHYMSSFNYNYTFDITKISISNIIDILIKNKGLEYQQYGLKKFIKYLFTKPIIYEFIQITYFQFSMFVFSYIIAYYTFKKKNIKECLILLSTFILGTIGYSLILLLTYLLFLSEQEVMELQCYDRYMATYILIEILFISYMNFKDLSKQKNFYKKLLIITVILVLFNSPKLFTLYKEEYVLKENKMSALMINQYTEENSKVFIIADINDNYQLFEPYLIGSRKLEKKYGDLYNNLDVDKDEIIKTFNNNDYLFIIDLNYDFIQMFQDIFSDEIQPQKIYKLSSDDKYHLVN